MSSRRLFLTVALVAAALQLLPLTAAAAEQDLPAGPPAAARHAPLAPDHQTALVAPGSVVAWGRNDWGQATVPAGLSDVTAIAAGYDHSLALKSDGTVVAWGRNDYGQSNVPAGLSGVTAIAAGVPQLGAEERRHGRRLGQERLGSDATCRPG